MTTISLGVDAFGDGSLTPRDQRATMCTQLESDGA